VVSVVIPARDAAGTLPAVLAALGPDLDVVVVDNGSRDATAALAAAAGARVVEAPRPHRALARNLGAAAARGDKLLFLDADCVPAPGWAAALAGCLDAAELAGGPVLLSTAEPPSAHERFDALWRLQQERTVREGGWSGGGNLGIARAAFERLGGFDTWYRAGDDVDLCVRAGMAGMTLAWCPGAEVTHPAARSLAEVLRRALRQGASGTRQHRRLEGRVGRRCWHRPGAALKGGAALAVLGIDAAALDPAERRRMARIARADYAARMAGSLWGDVWPRGRLQR
jgi:glycosyltransferase involved in cell wall biosynthesis